MFISMKWTVSNKKRTPKEVLKAVKASTKRLKEENVTSLVLCNIGVDEIPPPLFDNLPALTSLDCLILHSSNKLRYFRSNALFFFDDSVKQSFERHSMRFCMQTVGIPFPGQYWNNNYTGRIIFITFKSHCVFSKMEQTGIFTKYSWLPVSCRTA